MHGRTLRMICKDQDYLFQDLLNKTNSLTIRRYGVPLRIQSECGKMWTRITLNMYLSVSTKNNK